MTTCHSAATALSLLQLCTCICIFCWLPFAHSLQVDRAYIGAPAVLKIADAGPRSVLLIHKHGFADAVVWNPAEASRAAAGRRWWLALQAWPQTCSDRQRGSQLACAAPGASAAINATPAAAPGAAQAKAASMGDLGADNWRGFVCVEVAQARSGAVQLQAGQEWAASQTLEYDTLGES